MGVKIRCPDHRPAEFKAGNWWALIDAGWPLKCAECEARATAAYYVEDSDGTAHDKAQEQPAS